MRITKSELRQLVKEELIKEENWFTKLFKKEEEPPKLSPEEAEKARRKELWRREVEQAATTPGRAYYFAKEELKRPWSKGSEGEKKISWYADWSYKYAIDVIKGPFELGEKSIAKDPAFSAKYARHILKGRFPAGEEAIAKSPKWAFHYAAVIIKGRWEPAEKIIKEKKDGWRWGMYVHFVKTGQYDVEQNFGPRPYTGWNNVVVQPTDPKDNAKNGGYVSFGASDNFAQPSGDTAAEDYVKNIEVQPAENPYKPKQEQYRQRITKSELKQMIKEELYNKN